MLEWIRGNRGLIWWTAIVSAVMLALAVVITPWLVSRLPADYLSRSRPSSGGRCGRRGVFAWARLVVRNVLGGACVALGSLLLVLPGQGILTILIGVLLMDFPGKLRMERWFLSRPRVLRAVNWVREQRGVDPLRAG